ncbi:MAG TPA: serine protease [Polyangiaceae bacterium]|nr:serine protease [Polyangiaceae bacterium]
MATTDWWMKRSMAALAAAFALVDSTGARASLIKPSGSPPLIMPNTLLVESGEPRTEKAESVVSGATRAALHEKRTPRTCSAAAVRIPDRGTRIVTARHCADHRNVEVLDEAHHLTPVRQVDAAGEVDLSVLEVEGKVPWEGFEIASAASVPIGERLCAWHMWRGPSGILRERICAQLIRRQERVGADPLLVLNHPYPAGTSGSALVDRDGRVVGIVVASTGVSGLAEPIDGVLKLPPPPTLAAADSRKPKRR